MSLLRIFMHVAVRQNSINCILQQMPWSKVIASYSLEAY